MKSKQEQILELLAKHDCKITNATYEGFIRAVDAIYNPPAQTRDHNSLEVTENTPKGTLVLVWDTPAGFKFYRHFSHMDRGRVFCFHDGCKNGPVSQWKHAERYIGQHFIPWDTEQSGENPSCNGRVRVQFRHGPSLDYHNTIIVQWNHVTGYLPITENGEIDWERVPR